MPDMKRVTTREFLRNINSMTEPVEVYTRSRLKGTWTPYVVWDGIVNETPNSEPAILGADVEAPGARRPLGASRPIKRK